MVDNKHVMAGDEFIAPACERDIEVLFEDQDLLVIDKPSGLLSLSGKNPLNKDSVHFRLVQQYSTALMTHRLDFGTSGLMLIALNRKANAHITKQFQSREVLKRYTAVLYGHMSRNHGVVDLPIARGHFPKQIICHSTGKPSQSYYKVVDRFESEDGGCPLSKVIFTPKTGRTHQLRVHSREIGHPIIGCDLYNIVSGEINTTHLADRLCLHAGYLSFVHPVSGETMKFDSICEF